MPELVDNLADLTSQKDRDALELALVSTIKDLLVPTSVAIYRGVGVVVLEHGRTVEQGERGPRGGAVIRGRVRGQIGRAHV